MFYMEKGFAQTLILRGGKIILKSEKIVSKGITALVCTLLILLAGCGKEPEVNKTDFMLDTFVTSSWHGENAEACYEEIKEMLTESEERLSTFKEGSEIYSVNEMSGKEPQKVSEETFKILKRSKELSGATGGSFDITVAPLVKLWDVTGEDPHVPNKDSIEEKKALISYEKLILDEENTTAFLKEEGMEIDLGAVLKGCLAQKALDIAEKHQVRGYISVGGNMAVTGKKDDGSDYVMGIRNPRGEGNDYIGTLTMDGLTMATAGDYERFFTEDGVRYHHILDTKTGYPAETDIISATVLSRDGLLADFLSTYIFMEGTDSIDKFEGYESFEFIAVDKNLNVYSSEGLKGIFKPAEDKKEFNFL